MLAKLRQQKERDAVLNTQLYKFLALLTKSYPPSKEFKQIFRIDMFEKPNKKAFQEVIYYLFHILNPVELKKRIPSWPIFDAKREIQFRKEVMGYINCLSQLYPHAEIGMVVASHLISPGGRKFIHLMVEITRLVVVEHLKRNGSNQVQDKVQFAQSLVEITRTKPDECQDVIDLFKGLTLQANKETNQLMQSNQEKMIEISNEIKALAMERKELLRHNQEMKSTLEVMVDTEGVPELTEIEEKVKTLVNIGDEANAIKNIVNHLCKNHNYLEYSGNLNFLQHFSSLERTFGTKIYDVCRIPEDKIDYSIHFTNSCNENSKKEVQFCKHLNTHLKLFGAQLSRN